MNHPLDAVERFIRDYVILPSEHAYTSLTLWAGHTHLTPQLDTTPRLVIYSPEYGCGKSRVLEVLQTLCHSPFHMGNVSPAYVYRQVDKERDHPPTLLLDEADTIWAAGTTDTHQDLRGLLNIGYRRGATVGRVAGPNRDKTENFEVFAPVALAGRGRQSIPDSVWTRAVIIPMRKRAPHELVKPWKRREAEPRGLDLREWLAQWCAELGELDDPYPTLPDLIVDRDLEVWEPLVLVADLAGGTWPERAREAAVAAVTGGRADADEMPLVRRLLADVRTVFGDDERLRSSVLLERLWVLPESPWGTMGKQGTGLQSIGLSRMLRDYQIRPGDIRFPDGVWKGYERDEFQIAWDTYLDPLGAKPATPATPATPAREQSAVIRQDEPVAAVAAVAGSLTVCQEPGCKSASDATGWCWSHREDGTEQMF